MPVTSEELESYAESCEARHGRPIELLRANPGVYYHAEEIKDKTRAPDLLVRFELWSLRRDTTAQESVTDAEAVEGPGGAIYYGVPAGDRGDR